MKNILGGRRLRAFDGGGGTFLRAPHPAPLACSCARAPCHGHARPGHVSHGRMPMTSQTLVISFHSSVLLL